MSIADGTDAPALPEPGPPPAALGGVDSPAAALPRLAASDVGQRIALLRLLLICGIVFIHVPLPLGEPGHFAVLRSFFVDGVFRIGVPVLSAISGYLLAQSLAKKSYGAVLRAKLRTLLVPLILWNLPLVIALYFVEKHAAVGYAFHVPAYPFDLYNWIDLTFGIDRQPINYPMYFIRDVFVTILLLPVFLVLLRHAPLVGLAIVAAVFASDLDGLLMSRGDIAINVYVGLMVGRSRFDPKALDRFAMPCFVAFLGLSALLMRFPDLAQLPLLCLAPWLVWPAASLTACTRVFDRLRPHAGASFAIFVIHAPVLMAIWALAGNRLTGEAYMLLWLLAPPAVISLAILIHRILNRMMPAFAAILFGAR